MKCLSITPVVFGNLYLILSSVLEILILLKILYLIKTCANSFGTYIASGIFAIFLFHFFINVGMVMGMMPITGIPLLFLSYGGSSLLMAMSSIGLIMSIAYRKNNFNELQ